LLEVLSLAVAEEEGGTEDLRLLYDFDDSQLQALLPLPRKNPTTCSKLSPYVCHCYVCAPRLPTPPSLANILPDANPSVDSPPKLGEISMLGRY
jgi:hypothetical protein